MPQRRAPLSPGEKGLARGSGLSRSSELGRGAGPKRTASLRSVSPTAKAKVSPTPAAAAKAAEERALEREARRIVRERSGGVCECCGRARATNFSHRKGAGQGGEWSAANGLDACGSGNASGCHGFIHQNPDAACELGWMLRRHQVPEGEPVVHAVFGRVLLSRDGTVEHVD
jgi:hypothetical protein